MNTNLRIAAIPLDIVRFDKQANLINVERALASLPAGTDIAVLPELFSTGFVNDATLMADAAESNTGLTMQTIASLAARYNLAIAGSFAAKTGHKIYNRGFFVEPSGDETFYDKHHLFCMSAEAKVFGHGGECVRPVRFRGWNVALIVCYDLRFPAWCRNRGNSYDLLLVPANWPSVRGYAWEHLLIARAIENQAVVVGANRGGSDDYGDYDGNSYIFDSNGRMVSYPLEDSQIILADVSLDDIARNRQKLPVAQDADDFDIKC
ncbi:MAG: nitrilase-related carbon-nitrogen hydrolase [Bacteroidales bacterium]|nr:nitrilase-related carbon-nitrogen hydrolase [Bacteroidales bacterium]